MPRWSVPRMWEGETVAIFGGGPSITQEQVNACRGLKSIAVNDAYRLAPWADLLYFADPRWYAWHKDKPEFQTFRGLKVSIDQGKTTLAEPDVLIIGQMLNYSANEISDEPDKVATGYASGYQAINIAYLAGAALIILLGFDARAVDGKTHFFGEHPVPTPRAWFNEMPKNFVRLSDALIARGVEVVNCSPGTALNCFRKESLESALSHQEGSVLPA